MARKRGGGHDEGGAHGGSWKIALADMMTVLMAFFLVMWLAAIVEPEKRAELAEAIQNLGAPKPKENLMKQEGVSPPSIAPESIIEELKPPPSAEEIKEILKNSKNVEVEETPEKLKITLKSDLFFESGRATLPDSARKEIEKIAETLASRPYPIIITGYTDNAPIHNLQFPSNWELSAARAASVARVLIDMDVDKRLITVQGRADNEPVAPNNTKFGRTLNRRVVIEVDKTHRFNPKTGKFEPVQPEGQVSAPDRQGRRGL